MLFGSVIIVIISLAFLIHLSRQHLNSRTVYLWIGMNVVTMGLLFGSAEILARLLSKEIATGRSRHLNESLLGHHLYPQSWSRFSANAREVIDKIAREGSYLVYDPTLGWTNGTSRSDKVFGIFFTSAEGLRSPQVGLSFSDQHMRLAGRSLNPASVRIAYIGDSFTFGDEVRCEDTWEHVLETFLQSHVQSLNFGVNAYGLNQVFLKYTSDAHDWKPHIVVIGIGTDMIKRIINIYPFLRNPEWNLPFARPRLVVRNSTLATINHPVPEPEKIFAYASLSDLPYLNLDEYYRPYQWHRGGVWRLVEQSYVFRLAYSFRTPADDQEETREEAALQLSTVVIQQLIREVVRNGATPLIVYHPSKDELNRSRAPQPGYVPLAIGMLRNAGVEYFDPTPCLITLGAKNSYMDGGHYSPQANREVAHCLRPVLRGMIDDLKP
jgi:hypothetical protein